MRFELPQALLLAIPLGLLLWRTGRIPGPPMWLRALVTTALVLALARPRWVLPAAGADVVVVADLSRSMPHETERRDEELVRLLEAQRRHGDRLAVMGFGRAPRIELPLTADGTLGGFEQPIDARASNLGAALDAARSMIPDTRTGRILVLSDGQFTGVDPRAAARRLASRGIPIDFRWMARPSSALDLAVVSLDPPTQVDVREPFELTAVVHASRAATAEVTLLRDGKPLVRGPYAFQAGDNVLTFQDRVKDAGLARYTLRVDAAGDGRVGNDVGRAVARVSGKPRVLLLSSVGADGLVARSLRKAGIVLRVRPPSRLTLGDLDGVSAVVLENVDASSLGEAGLDALAEYVKQAGGGLVMTGGRHSFGEGGYRKSPVEDLLPVSLEIRREQRRTSIALAIVMDRSGSMAVQTPGGRTKMSLADEGAVSALELLDEQDEASVAVVDTEAHLLFPMRSVKGGLPLDEVGSAQSAGGGIYIGVALRAARDQILRGRKATRHVLLFADASDSEEPGDYVKTLAELKAQGVTVSVIGMGTPKDSDAALLEDIARRGGGQIYFAEDPDSLPRIFSQDTLAVARASFVDEATPVRLGADLPLLGRIAETQWPSVGGYNVTYLKPGASVGLRSGDSNDAPLLAFWPRAAGRVVAFPVEADGKYTGALRQLSDYPALLTEMVRWAMGPAAGADSSGMVARSLRQGDDLHVTLDFDPDHPPTDPPRLILLPGDGSRPPPPLPMRPEAMDRLGAHFQLPGPGTWFPVIQIGDRILRAPPVSLPYAPELQPRKPGRGHATLVELAAITGGVERLSMAGLFRATRQSRTEVPLAPYLVALALVALVAEVMTRRMLAGRVRPSTLSDPGLRAVAASVAKVRVTEAKPQPVREFARASSGSGGTPAPELVPSPESEVTPEPRREGMGSALERARERARRRTGR